MTTAVIFAKKEGMSALMEGYAIGEIIELVGKGEFICCQKVQDDGKNYVFLMSNFKPLEIIFAEEIIQDENTVIRTVGDSEKKQRLLQLFRENIAKSEAQKAQAELQNQDVQSQSEPKEPEVQPQPDQEKIRTLNGDITDCELLVGEGLLLEEKGEFSCAQRINIDGKEYSRLISVANYREFIFVEMVVVDGVLSVKVVKDPDVLDKLRQHVKKHPFEPFKQMLKDHPKINKKIKERKKEAKKKQ